MDLEAGQGRAAAQSKRVFILSFDAKRPFLLRANREANALTHRLAEPPEGLPWDEECRLLYSRTAWQKRRVDSSQGDVPDGRGHVNMRAYRNPDSVRIVALGIRKFGLPDFVVEQTPGGSSRATGNTVNAWAQRLLEGQRSDGGPFKLGLADIRPEKLLGDLLENPREGPAGRASLRMTKVPRERGDPQNLLLALEFSGAEANNALEKQEAAFAAL